jgi:ComF family protein
MLEAAWLDALAVLLPVECAGCGAWDRSICTSCRERLEPAVTARELGDGVHVWAGMRYEGVARSVMLALKAQQRVDAARALAPALAEAVHAALREAGATGSVDAVAVPGTRAAFRRRGYDPVRLLMARAGITGRRVFAAARPHRSQKQLGVDQRDRNLRGAFRVRRSLSMQAVAGHRILLIDDVVTSGATLREAARVLRESGAEVIGAAVVASTERRFGGTVTAWPDDGVGSSSQR